MKIKEIVSALERFAPLPLQDGFDNAGLQVGLTEAEATGALLCLDVTEAVVDEAVMLGYNLIISHHPLIFKGYKSIIGRDYIERCVLKAIKNDIVIYSAHTNLDNAPGGVNYKIAEKIGLKNVRILDPKEEYLLKFVTFVPDAQADRVRKALFEAGCGCIGNYDSCSYNLEGEGTFRAQRGTSPFCGEIGELHKESEVRIETILPAFKKAAVIKALLATHPYEEPAFDFYPLKNTWTQVGSGAYIYSCRIFIIFPLFAKFFFNNNKFQMGISETTPSPGTAPTSFPVTFLLHSLSPPNHPTQNSVTHSSWRRHSPTRTLTVVKLAARSSVLRSLP